MLMVKLLLSMHDVHKPQIDVFRDNNLLLTLK